MFRKSRLSQNAAAALLQASGEIMKTLRSSLLSAGLLVATACSPPQLAGDPLTADGVPQPDGTVSCSAVRPQTEPDLMAWDPQSRGLLSVLHRQSAVVVRYSAKGCNVELELLTNCQAKGEYQFAPYSSRKSKVAHNENELYAELPLGAAALAGKLKGSRALRTDFMFIGIDSLPTSARYRASDLRGADCSRATHIVSRLYLGGFAMATGESRSMDVSTTFFGAGAGGKSDASLQTLDSEGNPEACANAEREGKPNHGCQAALRIGLLPIEIPATAPVTIDSTTLKVPQGIQLDASNLGCVEDHVADAKLRASDWYQYDDTFEQFCPRTVVRTAGELTFQADSAAAPSGAEADGVLEDLAALLRENPSITKFAIRGHTSNRGNIEKNINLSGQRALAIKHALEARGIAPQRLVAIGHGQSMPIADNTTENGPSQNERVDFQITGLAGREFTTDRAGRIFR
jgi:outer membrane protein OmpA-like peptidoglycan-associated protein